MARIPIPFANERQTAASGPMLGANAQGGRLGDFAGEAAGQVSQALGSVADVMVRREEDQAVAWSTNAASKFKLDQFQRFQQSKDSAPVGGDGLTKQYMEGYDTDAQALVDSAPTPRAKHYLNVHLNQFRTQMGEQSIREEYSLGKQYLASSAQDAVDSSSHLIGDPGGDRSSFDSELTTQLASIKKLSLPPDVKDKLSDHAKKTLTDAYWGAFVRDDPQGAAQLLRGQQPLSTNGVTSPQEMIRNEAKAQGISPHAALAIASIENDTFDPSRPNAKGSSAQGLFQVISSTWNELGGSEADRGDAATQAKLGVKNLAQNARAFKDTFKREPTPGELYSTQWGLGFSYALAKAPDNMPVSTVFSNVKIDPATAMPQNALPPTMTAGQLRAAFNTQMAKAIGRTQAFASAPAEGEAPAAPLDANVRSALANTSIPQQQAYLTHAESMARKDDSQKKAEMLGRVQDTNAALTNLQQPPNPPTLPELVDTFGAVGGAREFAKQQDLQGYAHTASGFATMPTPQIKATLANTQPSPGEGYAERYAAWQKTVEAAQHIDTLRKADPVAFGIGPGGIMQKIDWTQPAAFSGPLKARFIQAGVASQQYATDYVPFENEDVQRLGPMLDHGPVQQAQDVLKQIHDASDTEEHYQKGIAQLAPNHPTLAVAGSLPEIGYAGIQNPAQYILKGDRLLNPGKEDKADAGKSPKILMPPDSQGGFRDMWDKSVGKAFAGSKSSDQYLNAAIAYYVGKQDPGKRSDKVAEIDAKLWKEAVNVVAPSVDWSNGKVLVPQGVYPNQFRATMTNIWPDVMKAYGLNPDEHNMEAYPLEAGPDGMYAVKSGTTALWGANGYPVKFGLDGSIPPMTPLPQPELPPEKLGKKKDPFILSLKSRR
jgi:hypothetical protein